MSQLYTTPEAAKETGIPEGTIRSWLSRHPGVFVIDVHIIIEDSGRKMWTEQGIALLRTRATENAADTIAENDADVESIILEQFLQAGEQKLAERFFQELPKRTLSRIKRMLTSPTPEERELVEISVQAAISGGASHLLTDTNARRLIG